MINGHNCKYTFSLENRGFGIKKIAVGIKKTRYMGVQNARCTCNSILEAADVRRSNRAAAAAANGPAARGWVDSTIVGLAGGHSGKAAPRFGSHAHNAWASRPGAAAIRLRIWCHGKPRYRATTHNRRRFCLGSSRSRQRSPPLHLTTRYYYGRLLYYNPAYYYNYRYYYYYCCCCAHLRARAFRDEGCDAQYAFDVRLRWCVRCRSVFSTRDHHARLTPRARKQ